MSEDTVARKVRSYESDELVVEYDVKRCITSSKPFCDGSHRDVGFESG